jgi:hypothetical protein
VARRAVRVVEQHVSCMCVLSETQQPKGLQAGGGVCWHRQQHRVRVCRDVQHYQHIAWHSVPPVVSYHDTYYMIRKLCACSCGQSACHSPAAKWELAGTRQQEV